MKHSIDAPYAVLFDLRDTLVDVNRAYKEANRFLWHYFKDELGVDVLQREFDNELDDVLKYIKRTFHLRSTVHDWASIVVDELLGVFDKNLSKTAKKKLLRDYENTFVEYVKLFPDAKFILEYLDEHDIPAGVIIDGTKRRENKVLRELGIRKHFSVIVISEEVGKNKFSMRPLRRALAELQMPVQNVFVVGDRLDKDIVHANKLGCISVKIKRRSGRYAYTSKTKTKDARHTITSLRELVDLLPETGE